MDKILKIDFGKLVWDTEGNLQANFNTVVLEKINEIIDKIGSNPVRDAKTEIDPEIGTIHETISPAGRWIRMHPSEGKPPVEVSEEEKQKIKEEINELLGQMLNTPNHFSIAEITDRIQSHGNIILELLEKL